MGRGWNWDFSESYGKYLPAELRAVLLSPTWPCCYCPPAAWPGCEPPDLYCYSTLIWVKVPQLHFSTWTSLWKISCSNTFLKKEDFNSNSAKYLLYAFKNCQSCGWIPSESDFLRQTIASGEVVWSSTVQVLQLWKRRIYLSITRGKSSHGIETILNTYNP